MISNTLVPVTALIIPASSAGTVTLPATVDAQVAMPAGNYTQGLYKISANDGADAAANAYAYFGPSGFVDVEPLTFGHAFEFTNNGGVFSVRNLSGLAQTITFKAVKE